MTNRSRVGGEDAHLPPLRRAHRPPQLVAAREHPARCGPAGGRPPPDRSASAGMPSTSTLVSHHPRRPRRTRPRARPSKMRPPIVHAATVVFPVSGSWRRRTAKPVAPGADHGAGRLHRGSCYRPAARESANFRRLCRNPRGGRNRRAAARGAERPGAAPGNGRPAGSGPLLVGPGWPPGSACSAPVALPVGPLEASTVVHLPLDRMAVVADQIFHGGSRGRPQPVERAPHQHPHLRHHRGGGRISRAVAAVRS